MVIVIGLHQKVFKIRNLIKKFYSLFDYKIILFVKGHVDPGEEELTAAIRETEEEAGISIDKDFKLLSQTFKIETCYLIKGKFPKKVIYWIAEASETANIKLSHEHTGFKWLTLKETLDIVGFEATKEVFIKADDFIRKNNQHSQNKQFRI